MTIEKFWEQVEFTDTCWLWTGKCHNNGYAQVRVGNLVWWHQIAYEYENGLILEGLQIDHLCRIRNCVNPAHLEAVTTQENTKRGNAGNKGIPRGGHEYCNKGIHQMVEGNF